MRDNDNSSIVLLHPQNFISVITQWIVKWILLPISVCCCTVVVGCLNIDVDVEHASNHIMQNTVRPRAAVLSETCTVTLKVTLQLLSRCAHKSSFTVLSASSSTPKLGGSGTRGVGKKVALPPPLAQSAGWERTIKTNFLTNPYKSGCLARSAGEGRNLGWAKIQSKALNFGYITMIQKMNIIKNKFGVVAQ